MKKIEKRLKITVAVVAVIVCTLMFLNPVALANTGIHLIAEDDSIVHAQTIEFFSVEAIVHTLMFLNPVVLACTGIRLIAEDDSVVHARTMDYIFDLDSEVIIVPHGYQRIGTTPESKNGRRWNVTYASIGANGHSMREFILDGFNEAGLASGLFSFRTFAEYIPYTEKEAPNTIAPWELVSYILDNFANVQEVKDGLSSLVVADVLLQFEVDIEGWEPFTPPLHYVVHDIEGNSIVIEYVNGKLNIHDNPLGIITNSPTFDWHMTNLRNYINFSATGSPPMELKVAQESVIKLEPFGTGTGTLGIPGDLTSPSRFVRAALFNQSLLPSKRGLNAVLQAFHLLNNFDIPKGAIREEKLDNPDDFLINYTLWTTASDLKAKQFYFRTYENSQIRMIDLTKMDLDKKDIAKISMKGEEVIQSLMPPMS